MGKTIRIILRKQKTHKWIIKAVMSGIPLRNVMESIFRNYSYEYSPIWLDDDHFKFSFRDHNGYINTITSEETILEGGM